MCVPAMSAGRKGGIEMGSPTGWIITNADGSLYLRHLGGSDWGWTWIEDFAAVFWTELVATEVRRDVLRTMPGAVVRRHWRHPNYPTRGY